jgi:hypothetical protein
MMNHNPGHLAAFPDHLEVVLPLEDWTIAQLLRFRYPDTRLRQRFQEEPYLDQVTLGQVLGSPFALNDFLAACRSLPQCGETSINRLRAVIENASRGLEAADQLAAQRRCRSR